MSKITLKLLIFLTCFKLIKCENDSCYHFTSKDPRHHYTINMTNYNSIEFNVDDSIKELTQGDNGYVILRDLFQPNEIEHAKELIQYLINEEGDKNGGWHKDPNHQANFRIRIWNLLNKGEIFQKIVQHPVLVDIASQTLGDDFQLGSVLSNTILPGAFGQEPHLDYPYWDYFNRKKWPIEPKHPESNFFLSLKVIVMLDPFTVENGATSINPGSQKIPFYPWNEKDFEKVEQHVEGKSGDVMLFFGLLQHRATANKSTKPRNGLIIQYLPKYIRPMEDLKQSIDSNLLESFSPILRKMLLLDYPYPAVLDKTQSIGENKYDI